MVGPGEPGNLLVKRERGAIAIIIGVGMVFIMGFAAIAVDLGNGWAERRHVQNGADLAALAASVELATGGSSQAAVDEILGSVDANVRAFSASEWLSPNCTDSEQLDQTAADLGLTPASECISFKYDLSEIRVKVPPQTLSTSFAPIIGVDALTINASANAGGRITDGSPPPFAVLDGATPGAEVCLRTSSNIAPGDSWMGNGPGVAASVDVGATDPCDSSALDASSQYMGTIDPPLWFDDNGAIICLKNQTAYMVAIGVDHELARFTDNPTPGGSPGFGDGGYGTPDPRTVEDGCNPTPNSKPNTVKLTTGVSASDLRCGFLSAFSGNCGSLVPGSPKVEDQTARLQQGAFVQGVDTFLGESMDNEPLWGFIRPDIASAFVPSACQTVYANKASGSWDYYDLKDEMVECLTRWVDAAFDPIFHEDIALGSRFMFAPILAENSLDTAAANGPTACVSIAASKCVHINDWVPIYVQTLYVSEMGLAADCDPNVAGVGRHQAGQEFSCGGNNKNLDAASALVIGCGMLPTTICNTDAGGDQNYPGGTPVPIIGLTK